MVIRRRKVKVDDSGDTDLLERSREDGRRGKEVLLAEERIIRGYKDKIKNPITAIRSFCVECMGGGVREIASCTAKDCSLYPFRMGTNTMDIRTTQEYKDKMEAKHGKQVIGRRRKR